MALECLCDFLAEPTFLVEMYVNYDCDIQRSNLTEMLVAALADGAYAGPDRLSGARAACVAALTAALRRLHERCATAAAAAAASAATAVTASGGGGDYGGPHVVDGGLGDSEQGRIGGERGGIGGAAIGGEGGGLAASATDSGTLVESVLGTPTSALPAAAVAAAAAATAAAATAAGTTSNGRLPSPSRCREARRRKAALTRGARAFAKKPREGLKLLQREGLFRRQQQQQQQSSLDAKEVAAFLRATPGLDKAAVGAYLGEAGAKRVDGRGGGGGSPEGTVAVAAVAEAVLPPSKERG
ncbi:unnamed protein product, partial [Ectocarpus sp. 12 AP-2014]